MGTRSSVMGRSDGQSRAHAGHSVLTPHFVEHAGHSTRPGSGRECFLISYPIYVVAEGVGHRREDDQASRITIAEAVRHTSELIVAAPTGPYGNVPLSLKALEDVAMVCQAAVRDAATSDAAIGDMATTLTMAVVTWPIVQVVHVGNSRCYALRSGSFQRVTDDQTVAGRLNRAGVMTDTAMKRSPLRRVLASSISGGPKDAQPQIAQWRLQPKDAIVLCTEGVGEALTDSEIAEIVRSAPAANVAARTLVDAAHQIAVSSDATAVVVRFYSVAH